MRRCRSVCAVIILSFGMFLGGFALSGNKGGVTTAFQYQETSGVNRTAWATNCTTKVTAGPIQLTSDAQWMVQVPGKPNVDGPYEWLTYQGTDGDVWLAKLHCHSTSASGDTIDVWMEQKKRNGGSDQNSNMVVIDWDGGKWEVAPLNIATNSGKPASQQVQFQLNPKPRDFR